MAKPRKGKNKGGRPRTAFQKVVLDTLVDDFLKWCKRTKNAPSKVGLAVFLDVTKDTLNVYLHEGEKKKAGPQSKKISDAIKKVYDQIELWWNSRLSSNAPTGAIFYTKAAFGYRDRVEVVKGPKTFSTKDDLKEYA